MITSIQIDSCKWVEQRCQELREERKKTPGILTYDPEEDVGFLVLNLDQVKAIQLKEVPTGTRIHVIWTDSNHDDNVFYTDLPVITVNNQISGNIVS